MRPKANNRAISLENTRRKILSTAERLFAEHGFAAISMRKISEAAGQGNNNAVQYHFKSKEGLIAAIIAARSEIIEMKRHALLLSAAEDGILDDVETLLSISYLPPTEIVDERGRHIFARFITQFILEHSKWKNIPLAGSLENSSAAQKIIIERLKGILPHIPIDVLAARQRRGIYMILGEVVAWDNDPAPVARKGPVSAAIRDVLTMIIGGFGADVRS